MSITYYFTSFIIINTVRSFAPHSFRQRRGSFTAQIFNNIQNNLKRGMNDKELEHNKHKKSHIKLEKYTNPNSNVLLPRHISWWESFIAFLVIVQVIFLPYILAFTDGGGQDFQNVEFVVDILFCVDMLIQFNVAYR